MSELTFVIKSFVLTVLIVVFLQMKVGSTTLESYSQRWLQKSPVSGYIQSVAAGGTLALRNLYYSVKSGITGTAQSYRQRGEAQAGR